ncbi:hypothetical protein IHN32_09995 [Deinococcus sp. 14RED07]|uniref:Mom family adenine methylcarbamoylation protein n=1 Tax=Deinococcus sp. 14RED07 TaxID=2745874 RepID=UPI001E44BEBC|nr:hypothetical protein [Deinococcus sp. 14RED07]MCD0176272.1 hypothetical protein [Deinococcus sp. 14RED07]
MLTLTPGGAVHSAPLRQRGPDPDREQATAREFEVRAITAREARPLIESWHYARGVGHLTAAFALHRRDCGSIVAVAGFNPPSLGAAKFMAAGICTHQEVIGLSRLCYHPQAPRNAGSMLLAASIRTLPGRWAVISTYADEAAGVIGTTYRAGNFRYMGTSAPRAVWLRRGVQVSTQRGGHTLTHDEMLEEGCQLLARARMHRYRYWRASPEERRLTPYPEPHPVLLNVTS